MLAAPAMSTTHPLPQHRTYANAALWTPDTDGILRSAVATYDYSTYASTRTPLVVDLGGADVRAGWADTPDPLLVFENRVARVPDRKLNNAARLLVGDDSYLANAQLKGRSCYEGGLLTSPESLEAIFDYLLTKLSVADYPVDHPLLLTEPLCNAAVSRAMTSEVLFENYAFPSICYASDSLLSYFHHESTAAKPNVLSPDNCRSGLVISTSFSSTHIVPFVGQADATLDRSYGPQIHDAKRINYGVAHMAEHLMNLLGAKYSENIKKYFDKIEKYNQNYTLPPLMTFQNATEFVNQYCFVSPNYVRDIGIIAEHIASPSSVSSTEKSATPIPSEFEVVVQLPYAQPVGSSNITLDSQEAERLKQERRKEQGRRLTELTNKKREQKLKDAQADLEYLRDLRALQDVLDKEHFTERINESGYDISNVKELDELLALREHEVDKIMKKIQGIVEEEVELTFPLLDIADEDLDEEQLKEKQRQKMHKIRYDSALRQRKEKELIRQQRLEQERLEDEHRNKDLEGWLATKHRERRAVIERILARQRRRTKLSDRKSKESEQKRKTMALMMDDAPKSKHDGSGRKKQQNNQTEDSFGQDDRDWDIYKELQGDDDSEDEEDTMELSQLDEVLVKHDPNFVPDDPFESGKELMDTSLFRLAYGTKPEFDNYAYLNQMRVNAELIRVPEVLFQPSIVGLDQAGLIENVNQILRAVGPSLANKMTQNIYLTGGFSQMRGFKERVEAEIRSYRPFDSVVKVFSLGGSTAAYNSWRGGADFSRFDGGSYMRKSSITRQMYIENGSDYITEHVLGNKWYKNYV